MLRKRWASVVLLAAAMVSAYGQEEMSPATVNPNLVHNGGLENPKHTWMDTTCNYMALYAGSTAIPGWTVSASTVNEIVWAMTPTCDGHRAAAGSFFVDLTGFGSDSPNGAVQQTLKNLVAGHVYNFSMDVITDRMPPLVTIDGLAITLKAGKPFKRGTDIWTPETGSFTARSSDPVLEIQNQAYQVEFIDSVIVRAQ